LRNAEEGAKGKQVGGFIFFRDPYLNVRSTQTGAPSRKLLFSSRKAAKLAKKKNMPKLYPLLLVYSS